MRSSALQLNSFLYNQRFEYFMTSLIRIKDPAPAVLAGALPVLVEALPVLAEHYNTIILMQVQAQINAHAQGMMFSAGAAAPVAAPIVVSQDQKQPFDFLNEWHRYAAECWP